MKSLSSSVRGEAEAIAVVDRIIAEGISLLATDVHINPNRSVRLRVGGTLVPFSEDLVLDSAGCNYLVTRLKLMADVSLKYNPLPQDGVFSVKGLDGSNFCVRASFFATTGGENCVLRLWPEVSSSVGLSGLGFSEAQVKDFEQIFSLDQGVIFVAGPVGSGHLMTLNCLMNDFLRWSPAASICSLHHSLDTIVSGVDQVVISPGNGYTMDRAISMALRRDLDVIVVDTVVDKKTLEQVLRAGMTGHLVFAGVHARGVREAYSAVADFQGSLFSAKSVVKGILTQRLVPVLCPNCRCSSEYTVPGLFSENPDIMRLAGGHVELFESKGCSLCLGRGFQGEAFLYYYANMSHLCKGGDALPILEKGEAEGLAAAVKLLVSGRISPQTFFSLDGFTNAL